MFAKIGITLKEPSTWVGIVAILSMAGVQVAPEYKDYIVQFGVALGALLSVIFKWEPAPSKPEDKPLSEVLADGRDETPD